MVQIRFTGDELWERIGRAVDKVKDRLNRVVAALQATGIPYAVIGGNAVQIWVAQADESVVRNTRDVDILLNRSDLPSAITALEQYGFLYRHSSGLTMFLDGSDAKARDAVHVLFAGEKVREDYVASVPLVDDCVSLEGVRTINLQALVQMKLTSYRDKDRVHLRDMISVGLIDFSWPSRFSTPLNERLQAVLDDPDG